MNAETPSLKELMEQDDAHGLSLKEIMELDGSLDLRYATAEQKAGALELESTGGFCISPDDILRRSDDDFNLATAAGLLQCKVRELSWTNRRLAKQKGLRRHSATTSVAANRVARPSGKSRPANGNYVRNLI